MTTRFMVQMRKPRGGEVKKFPVAPEPGFKQLFPVLWTPSPFAMLPTIVMAIVELDRHKFHRQGTSDSPLVSSHRIHRGGAEAENVHRGRGT